MATKDNVQGVVLALFGASAGGHLAGLTASATANGLTAVAADLAASAGFILGKDLSTAAAFRDNMLTGLGISSTNSAYAAAAAWADGELAKAGANRGEIVASAVSFLAGLTDATSPFYAVATAYRATVTAAVTWSEGAGATVFSVAALQAQQGVNGAEGNTFTLTSATNSFTLTAGNDTVTGVNGTLNDNDVVLDSSSVDKDVLTATVSANSGTARLNNVETVNLNGSTVVTGMNLTNVLGTKTLNVNTALPAGSATVTNAGSLNAAEIVAGANIRTLSVTATASGTRDTVVVNANKAVTVTAAGGDGADTFAVTLPANATATIDGGGSVDKYTLTLNGSVTLDGATTTENVTIVNNEAAATVTLGANELNADYVKATGYAVTVEGTKNVTFKGTLATFDDKKFVNNGSGIVTIDQTDATAAADYNELNVNVVELSTAAAGAATVVVNQNTAVNLDVDIGQVLTLNLAADADTANAGTATVTVSDTQTAALTAGDEVGTLIVSATPDTASDTANKAVITLAEVDTATNNATVLVVNGSADLTITKWTNDANSTLSATEMTGKLVISETVAASTLVLGQGADTVTTTAGVTLIYAGAGNDKITLGNAANVVDGEAGNDSITGGTGAESLIGGEGNDTILGGADVDTINGGAGDDVIDAGAGIDTSVTTGSGADKVRLVSGQDGDTITDFDIAADVLQLTGETNDDIDLTDVTITEGTFELDGGTGNFDVKMTGVTATDVTAFVQLGRQSTAAIVGGAAVAATTYTALDTAGKDVVAGDLDDVLTFAADDGGTITGGAGADIYVVDSAATGTVEITDFVVGTDRLILTGDADSGANIDLSDVAVAAGEYTFDDNFIINLANAGSALKATDLSGSVQLGTAAAEFVLTDDMTVTGGSFNDYIKGTAGKANVINFTQDGGVDTITVFTTAEDDLCFDALTGINAGAGIAVAANASKVADAISGSVYIFADGSDGTGSQSIDFNGAAGDAGLGSDEVLADVAAFLEAGLGEGDGETYVVLINTTQGGTDVYAAYYVTGDADGIQADDIKLIGSIDSSADLVAGDVV